MRTYLRVHRVRVGREPSDPDWDAFLEASPGGSHQQSSLWAQVKAIAGWEVLRLTVHHGRAIVAGCQVLTRSLPLAGAIAYVPRGPVLGEDDPETLGVLLGTLDELARRERILYLKLQPAPDQHDVARALEGRGFRASPFWIAPRATVRVDLRRQPEALWDAMQQKTRRNIRRAMEQGVRVREGGEPDLEAFAALVQVTGERQGFTPYPPSYYRRMWQVFAPGERARLLIAEREGVPLAATLLLRFGHTVTYKMGGWTGETGNVRPNELLHWVGMDWARHRRVRFYDFDDLDLEAAEAALGERNPPGVSGLARFKLGFGGEVVTFPGAFDRAYRPLLGVLVPRIERFRGLTERASGRGGERRPRPVAGPSR